MAGILLEIRKKIGGIRNTRKITKAMQLVAASKMRQFQKRAVGSREYALKLLEILKRNFETDEIPETIYTKSPKRKTGDKSPLPTLFIIYTSDKGLCGALNTNILKALTRSKEWLDTPVENRLLITIGKKSKEFARINSIRVEKNFHDIPDKLSTFEALKIIDAIMSYWHESKVAEVVFLSPHYKNSFTYYPVFKTLLPFSTKMIESHLKLNHTDKKQVKFRKYMIYEPSKKRVLEALFEQLIENIFIQSFLELKASEYSSRMIAMQNATDAADGMIQDLTLSYNKTRQQVITQELAELIGASEALTI